MSFAGAEISTQARDGLDGDGYVVADPEAEVVDSIHVSNVVPEHSYKVFGLLMDAEAERPLLTVDDENLARDAEALTRETLALLEGEGSVTVKDLEDLAADYDGVLSAMVKAEAKVKPEGTSASVELSYGLDAGDLAGTKTVAFALLVDAKDGELIASEVDFGCEDQTCLIIPSEIGTTATDKTDGDHELIESARATIVDRVAYENLIPGKEYKLTGVLMDKETGKVLRVADREVTATKTFVPNAAAGSVDVEFTFNAVGLAGKEIVVFESLEKDGREVAVHADIDDESQTVSVTEAPEGSPLAKTGHDTGVATMLMLLMALFGGVIAQHYRREDGRASTVADPE